MNTYQFNVQTYMYLLDKETDDEISPQQMVYNIIKSYNIERYNQFYMIQSLLNDKKKYPVLEDQFEFVAEYILYKNLKDQGIDSKSEKMISLLKNMKKIWDKIFTLS